MPSFRILFNPRRVYLFEAYRPVIEKLTQYGHQPVIAPMQEEQDVIFHSYFRKKNYSYRLPGAEAAAAESWDLVVVSGSRYEREYRHPQNFVLFGHGGCGGGNSAEPYRLALFRHEQMTAYLATSVAEINLGEKFFPGIWQNKIVRIVGWPKLDRVITDRTSIKSKMQQLLSLDPGRPTVVFTTHWAESSLLRTIGFSVLNELCSSEIVRDHYNVIVTAHPLLLSDKKSLFNDIPAPLISLFCKAPHMHFFPADDSSTILGAGDIFICDYSSISYEAAAAGKPIILYRPDNHKYCDQKLLSLLKDAVIPLVNPSVLPDLIKQALEFDAERMVRLKQVADYVYDYQGTAANAAAVALIDVAALLSSG